MDDDTEPTSETKAKPPLNPGTAALGGIIGIVLGQYFGIYFLIPLVLGLVVFGILSVLPSSPNAFRVAWSIQAAAGLWMLIGAYLGNAWAIVAPDLIILTVGLTWLWVRPGLGPVLFLCLYQVAAGALTVPLLLNQELAEGPHKAVVMGFCLRAGVIGFLILGYRKMQKDEAPSLADPMAELD